jgi:HAD superfamily hydrolase (TIGR01549 family)
VTRWVCCDIGEVLIDETRIWSTWADVLGVPRFTFLAVLGAAVAAGGDHAGAFDLLGIADWRRREPAVQAAYGGFAASDLYPDAVPAITALRGAGYGVAVIGNQPARRHDELAAIGVQPDVMAMSETLGAEKPSPAFFAAALGAMGDPRPGDVAYVGDRVDNDVRPAAAAGLRPVWLRRGPWGLLRRDEPPAAELTISALAQLPGRLPQLWPT